MLRDCFSFVHTPGAAMPRPKLADEACAKAVAINHKKLGNRVFMSTRRLVLSGEFESVDQHNVAMGLEVFGRE
jgi:hypothetical protein